MTYQPLLKKAKIICIIKSGKDGSEVNHYHPISLLSNFYELLEWSIYNKITPVIDNALPKKKKQASFCSEDLVVNRSKPVPHSLN